MNTSSVLTLSSLVGLLMLAACGGDDDETEPTGEIPSFSVTGTVFDFATGEALDAQASVTVDGLSPPPQITTTGAEFLIRNVPLHSVFQILASAPPDYRSTFNPAVEVTEENLEDIQVTAISESYMADMRAAFAVDPAPDTSILIGRLVDDNGAPQAGVPGDAFDLDAAIAGPYFLDDQRVPDPDLSASSASGYFVLYNVPSGLIRVTSKDEAYGMSMADSPVAATAVTLADVQVGQDVQAPPDLPQVVSFSQHVAPALLRRGCDACHDGGGIGKDLGGLHLNGADEKMYKELVEEVSQRHGVTRVIAEPAAESLLLTMPSREDPPDVHPNITFASADDPDYQLILAWIEQGAPNN